jgi:hypothetical protein
MTETEIKRYVVLKAAVNKPKCYNGDWNVMLTLGSDINEHAPTIEKAYQQMTDTIFKSKHLQKYIIP